MKAITNPEKTPPVKRVKKTPCILQEKVSFQYTISIRDKRNGDGRHHELKTASAGIYNVLLITQ